MFRTNTCGELRLANAGQTVTLAGWAQRIRKMGGMTFIDLRDRYGITQLAFQSDGSTEQDALLEQANGVGREYVLQVKGEVIERQSKNPQLPTGEIEIKVAEMQVLKSNKIDKIYHFLKIILTLLAYVHFL